MNKLKTTTKKLMTITHINHILYTIYKHSISFLWRKKIESYVVGEKSKEDETNKCKSDDMKIVYYYRRNLQWTW